MTIKLSLTTVPVFQFVTAEYTALLSAVAKVIERNRGDAVLVAGEPVSGIYIVVAGSVGVYPEGAARALVSLGVGESIGEMSFLENSKASVTVRAESHGTTLVMLPHAEVARLAEAEPALGRAIYRGMAVALSRKLRTTTDRIADELDVGRRLISDLGSDAEEVGLESLPDEVVKRNASILAGLDAGLAMIEEMRRKAPEKLGSLAEVAKRLGDVRATCVAFYPGLARHVTAISQFLKRMEEFVSRSSRD